MFLFHPIYQGIAICLSIYTGVLGFQRFLGLHLHRKKRFYWKRHVRSGSAALTFLPAGAVGGTLIVRITWNGFLLTGLHGIMGLSLIPFLFFGIFSGFVMNRKKKKRTTLPFLHGLNNGFILIVALTQVYTGLGVYSAFVLGN